MTQGAPSDGLRVLNVRVGATRLALPASDVAEIFKNPRVTRVPNTPRSVVGVANLRGAVVPVLSLARLLGQESPATEGQGTESQATISASRVLLIGDATIGLIVDEVSSLSMRTNAAGHPSSAARLFIDDDGAVRIVDLESLIKSQFGAIAQRVEAKAVQGAARAPAATSSDEVAMLSFTLADQAYALRLDHVSEVMAVPPHIASLPHADVASLGVIASRDRLLPLVSLRALLGFSGDPADAPSKHVIVAKIGDSLIGLVVDALRVVLRAPKASISPVPTVLNRGNGEARIESIYRLGSGQGLVAILSPDRLFEDEGLAQILADECQRGSDMNAERQHAATEQVIVFRLGEEEYGLPIAAVDEIVALPDALTRVPRAPAFIEGVMNLRGKVVPIIDQRRRFAVGGDDFAGRKRVIVATIGDLQAGFIVDSVSEVLSFAPERLQPTPDLRSESSRMFDRIANVEIDGRMILLIDPHELLDRAERDLLAAVTKPDMGLPAS
ncbi:MAG: chemotaxis protein CheW [Methylocella sp.]